ncbi:MAG: aminotransferase class I/II-fold pyridoxal phosphate-dependent enzyme, partial [Zetaproteobacteria bacterium]|nr:aminotransferase class I/II-fold pyridoxal phosphate-dependent enzyme [Zetaproteobacteria bacterium]
FSGVSHVERDLFAKVRTFSVMFEEWQKLPQYQYKTVRKASKGTKTSLKGYRKKSIVMGSNDYLNLAAHPKVIEAALEATQKYGTSSTGSPLTTGQTDLHMELCEFLAKMLHKESAILFNSGYASNLGSLQGLVGRGDLMVADFLSHASIQDGMKQSHGSAKLFRHNSTEDLRRILQSSRDEYAGTLVLTEGVFSMDGDVPPLKEIISIAKEHDCRVYLDEAHSIGVLGETGGGLVEELDCHDDVDVIMGTFSKSFGGIGGFVAASKDVCDWLYWLARSHMFSISISPANAAAALQAGKLFTQDSSIIAQLKRNIKLFVEGMRALGAPIDSNHRSSVVPVMVGDVAKLGVMNKYLLDHGIFVVPIVYPAVSRNQSRFRFTVCAGLVESDIDYVLTVFENAMKEADFDFHR